MGRNRVLGAPYQTEVVTESFTTNHAVDAYMVGAVPLVVTLDPYAVVNDQVRIQDITDSAGTKPIVINASEGQEILNGFGSTISVETNGGGVTLTMTEDGWVPQANTGGNGAGTFTAFETFSVPQGPATSLAISVASVVVGPSSRVNWTVTFQVEAGSGTSLAGDIITGILTVDGVSQGGLAQPVELSVTNQIASIAITGSVGGLVPGSTHTFGAKFQNTTNGARTFASTIGQLTGYTY